jgi:3-oxoacyl-[acyl-carrier protein] reductase
VTGGSRGIGAAISRELGRAGARVAVNYRGNKEDAEAVADEAGGIAVQADVSQAEEAKRLIEDVESHLGDVDILVNNAGITRDTLLARMSDEDWEQVLATNLGGPFHTCRAVVRKMLRRRAGAIVNVTSVVGLRGNPGQANYAASKAGLVAMTKTVASEVARRGVTVNAVAPGLIETEMTEGLGDGLLELVPARRPGTPDDVAACVRFLTSGEAGYVTGVCLTVDGGLTA